MAIPRKARDGVLILGGGFAGGYVARLLGSGSTVVSLENYMLYTPMLPEAASGTLEPRHVVVPLRQMCRKAELLLGRVTGLDEERRLVAVQTEVGEFDIECGRWSWRSVRSCASCPSPAWPTTRTASRIFRTRSSCGITSAASWSRPTPRWTRSRRAGT